MFCHLPTKGKPLFECEHRLKPNDSANKETGGASPSPTEIKRDPLFVRRRKIVRTTSRAIRESPLQMLINIRRVAERQCEQRYGSSKAPTPTEVQRNRIFLLAKELCEQPCRRSKLRHTAFNEISCLWQGVLYKNRI